MSNEPLLPDAISIRPTWQGVLALLLIAYTDGTPEGRAMALADLKRMAAAADEAVATLGPGDAR